MCGAAPRAIQLPGNDPFTVAITDESAASGDGSATVSSLRAGVGLLNSPDVLLLSDDLTAAGAGRVRVTGRINMGLTASGVRDLVFRGARDGAPASFIAAVETAITTASTTTTIGTTFRTVTISTFEPRAQAPVTALDLTVTTGSVSVRDTVLVAGENGAPDALIVLLRQPDQIARVLLRTTSTGAIEPKLDGLANTCLLPTNLALANITVARGGSNGGNTVPRLVVTCQGDDAITLVDPRTLQETDAIRFFGRAPYAVVVADAPVPRAFVSFFLDNSIGVIDLAADGVARLQPRGRIGTPAPRPEDGRE